MVMFAFILLLGPILYKGFSGMGSASMSLFVTVGTLMAWPTLAILTRVSMLIFSTTRAELTVVPRLVLQRSGDRSPLGSRRRDLHRPAKRCPRNQPHRRRSVDTPIGVC